MKAYNDIAMYTTQQLQSVLLDQRSRFLNTQSLFERAITKSVWEQYQKTKEILVITGIRRCGKSSFMKLLWKQVRDEMDLSDEQCLYFNFEDERLVDFSHKDFAVLLEAYHLLHAPDPSQKIYLFLDEIQNVPHWERWLYRLYEEERYKICIAGSNATLLSSELASTLTGRNIPITLYPLSFYEFVVYWKGYFLTKKSLLDPKETVLLKKFFQEYLERGGMPEYLKTEQLELIQEYFKNILFRDIVQRYNIKHKHVLQELAHILLSNLGQIQSLRNLCNSLELKNISTVKNYLQYFKNAFLFFSVSRFSYSYKQQVYNPDKIYCIDQSFFNCIAFRNTANYGSLYENVCFLTLLEEKANTIFYYKTKKNYEVDFLVKRKNEIYVLIQVCFSVEDKKTREREERALLEAMQELNISQGMILNADFEEDKMIEGKKIRYYPLWKWCLGNL